MSAITCVRLADLRRVITEAAAWAGVEKFCWDPCGIFMAGCTWFLILWAEKRAWHYVNFENFIDILLFAIFNCVAVLALMCHFKAMCSDPGDVPFRELGAPKLPKIESHEPQWIDGEFVTTCKKCDVLKPYRAHHCSTCNRCVRMMDHHCPWMNNCIGELNHKFFILFCMYIFVLACVALCIVARFLLSCPVRWHKCVLTSAWEPLALMLFLMEILLFGLFTLIMSCDQLCGVAYDTTTLERMKGGGKTKPPSMMENLRRVFGSDADLTWFLPTKPIIQPRQQGADVGAREEELFQSPLPDPGADNTDMQLIEL